MPIVKSERHKEFIQLLRERLPDRTSSHCIFTAEYFGSFAESIGVSHDAAITAGLLHDLCRHLPPQELLQKAREYRISISQIQLDLPMLLHGPVAARQCEYELGIEDSDVLEAIAWHTTGRPGMEKVALGLYVADFSEPMRKHPGAAESREILRKQGFDAALKHIAELRHQYLLQKVDHVDPSSQAFYLWLNKVQTQ
jgi:predicted HD superfamily hydrolase involved in NAD metabolism